MKHTLLIATGNAGKVKEIRHEFELAAAGAHDAWLSSFTILGIKDLPTVPPECVEDEPTFEGNARKKARHYAAISGMLTLADDSGLCVDALHGAPGVYSARYAGVSGHGADGANNAKLLAAIDHVPEVQRTARFVCAMALATPARSSRFGVGAEAEAAIPEDTLKRELRAEDLALTTGEVHGILLREPRGANGFGYDPLFFFPQFNQTTAELDMTTKGQISHRGQALRKMIAWLAAHHASIPA